MHSISLVVFNGFDFFFSVTSKKNVIYLVILRKTYDKNGFDMQTTELLRLFNNLRLNLD